MDKTVAHLNIKHLRARLSEATDEATKKMILQLLAEEEAKLAALEKQRNERKLRSS
jgi:hypothetical protein